MQVMEYPNYGRGPHLKILIIQYDPRRKRLETEMWCKEPDIRIRALPVQALSCR